MQPVSKREPYEDGMNPIVNSLFAALLGVGKTNPTSPHKSPEPLTSKNRGKARVSIGGNGYLGTLGGGGLGNFDKSTSSTENQSNMWNLARNLLQRSPTKTGTQLITDKSGPGVNNPLGGLMQSRSPNTLFGGVTKMIQTGNHSAGPVPKKSRKSSGGRSKSLVAKNIMSQTNKTSPDSGKESIKKEEIKKEPVESPFRKAMRVVGEERKAKEAKELEDQREIANPFRKAIRLAREQAEEKKRLKDERKYQNETLFAKAIRLVREEKEAKVAAEAREADIKDTEIYKSKVITTSAKPKSPQTTANNNLRKSHTHGCPPFPNKKTDFKDTGIENDEAKAQRANAFQRSHTHDPKNLKNHS